MTARRQAARLVVLSVAAYGYGYWAAGSRPFTAGADAFVAVAFAPVAVLGARAWMATPATARTGNASRPAMTVGRDRFLLVVVAALVVLEVGTYVAGVGHARHDFPTVSSIYDELARWRTLKAAFFAAWLALGYGLFRS
ncbi:MAG TPA: hypothetical protein VE991_13540 [Acidimicrobiales bacterium]|nr:hypothetical protein [Acidimicrobiales bacterium]